jgi:metal-responsive CopG/Arc/MetJ family transcriptional regulator
MLSARFLHAFCTARLVTRLDEDLVAEVDALVALGVVANRSEAVRLASEGGDELEAARRR